MSLTHVFARIEKSERTDDGHLLVYGKAAGPELDLDKQVCDPEWLKSAMPEWFETGANIRQMHAPVAVGKGVELDVDGDNYWLTAKVVDPASKILVEEDVLTGFSVGIKAPRIVKDAGAPNGRIVGGKIIEVSLVDRGSNETCKLVLAKMAGDDLAPVEQVLTKDAGELDTSGSLDAAEEAEPDLIAVARDALSAWLASEAAEVAAGTGGTSVVRIICTLLEDLSWAASMDSWDDAEAVLAMKAALLNPSAQEDTTMFKLADVADLVKAATADGATDDDKAAAETLREALGLGMIEQQIADVQTKAATAEDLNKVAARLAKVEEMPAPGGPTRTAPEAAATNLEANAQVAELQKLADAVQNPEIAAAYRRRAEAIKAQARTA